MSTTRNARRLVAQGMACPDKADDDGRIVGVGDWALRSAIVAAVRAGGPVSDGAGYELGDPIPSWHSAVHSQAQGLAVTQHLNITAVEDAQPPA